MEVTWSPPCEDAVKINFDIAVQDNWLCAAVVCRNWKGDIHKVRFHKWPGSNPLKGEARAARLACSLALEFEGRDVVLEGDAQIVVNQVLESNRTPDWMIEAEKYTIRALFKNRCRWKLQWTPREGNMMAHKLARWGFHVVHRVDFIADDIPLHIVCCDDCCFKQGLWLMIISSYAERKKKTNQPIIRSVCTVHQPT